jgi:hypothetical protein
VTDRELIALGVVSGTVLVAMALGGRREYRRPLAGGGELDPALAALTEGWLHPVPPHPDGRLPVVTDGWRVRETGHLHRAVDLMYPRAFQGAPRLPTLSSHYEMPNGVHARAVARGRVSASRQYRTGGAVRIWHAGNLVTQYLHLAERFVVAGDVVEQGQPLGVIGYNPSDYKLNHLHFELLVDGKIPVDPEPYLSRWRAT